VQGKAYQEKKIKIYPLNGALTISLNFKKVCFEVKTLKFV